MSSDLRFEFTKENIDIYLKELGKEYRRQSGKGMPAELILIGGASVLLNYGFRNMTTDSEYLIAMIVRSGRQYKSDLADVLGILAEHEKEGTPLSMKQIRKAVTDLYGDWNSLPNASQVFIENVMENSGFEQLYEQITREEQETKELLIQLEENYPGIITRANVNGIAENLQEKADRASILARLRQKKSVDTKITDEKKSGG